MGEYDGMAVTKGRGLFSFVFRQGVLGLAVLFALTCCCPGQENTESPWMQVVVWPHKWKDKTFLYICLTPVNFHMGAVQGNKPVKNGVVWGGEKVYKEASGKGDVLFDCEGMKVWEGDKCNTELVVKSKIRFQLIVMRGFEDTEVSDTLLPLVAPVEEPNFWGPGEHDFKITLTPLRDEEVDKKKPE